MINLHLPVVFSVCFNINIILLRSIVLYCFVLYDRGKVVLLAHHGEIHRNYMDNSILENIDDITDQKDSDSVTNSDSNNSSSSSNPNPTQNVSIVHAGIIDFLQT